MIFCLLCFNPLQSRAASCAAYVQDTKDLEQCIDYTIDIKSVGGCQALGEYKSVPSCPKSTALGYCKSDVGFTYYYAPAAINGKNSEMVSKVSEICKLGGGTWGNGGNFGVTSTQAGKPKP